MYRTMEIITKLVQSSKKVNLTVSSCLLMMLSLIICLTFYGCDKDSSEELENKNSLYGVWAEVDDPDSFPLLVTKDCMVMNDTHTGASVLVPYVDASYEALEDRFAPNDEFWVYRYDDKNNVYILYSGEDVDENGTILFDTDHPLLFRATISGKKMEGQLQWPDFNYDGLVTREELLSNSKYAHVPSNIKIDFEEVRVYFRVK